MALSPSSSSRMTESPNQNQDLLNHLTRLITGENDFTPRSSTMSSQGETLVDSPAEFSPGSASSSSRTVLQRVSSTSSSLKKKRTKISDRLKRLGEDFGRFRPTNDKSIPSSPRVTVGDIQRAEPLPSREPSEIHDSGVGYYARPLSLVEEAEEIADPHTAQGSTNATVETPEAASLAKRIGALIDLLPFPTTKQNSQVLIPNNPNPPATEPDGRPIPPPDASPINDYKLLGFLSSPTIMNGSTVKGKPSIWSILEGLMPPIPGRPPADRGESIPGPREPRGTDGEDTTTDRDTIFSDNSSVMIYSPLIPTTDDLVELAELVPVGVEEEPIGTEEQSPIAGTSWTTMWPLSLWYSSPLPENVEQAAAPQRLSGETVISPHRRSVDSAGRPVRVQTVRAWVPSNTKISVQAMWWGYRIYLPPPVLEILSDKSLEAAKRASMITTALTWFFNNLPLSSLPAAVQPAALLLQRLVPFLGYIGTFISWSWGAIKSYDVGYGVILTATWLLPIALIPGTWHQYDFPMSPTQGAPTPLPPTSPPSDMASLPSTSPFTSPAVAFSPLSATHMSPSHSALSYLSPPQSEYYSLSSPGASSDVYPHNITSPALSEYYSLSSAGASSPVFPRIAEIVPIPPTPQDLAPVPPTPYFIPQEVSIGSPLMAQLLNGPIISTVPLPDEDAPAPVLDTKRKKDGRSRAKALFTRNSRK